MYPFAIINFAGGGTGPVGSGLKKFIKAGSTQTYYALGNNGDLYVMGGAVGNGLGMTGTSYNPSTGGWTITNTGVEDILTGLAQGAIIKKGGQFFTTGQYNTYPNPTDPSLVNDWRLLDPSFYTVDGYSVLDNAVTAYPGIVLCSNGDLYQNDVTNGFSKLAYSTGGTTGIPAGSKFKYLFVGNEMANRVVITTTGAVYAQGYNGMGKAFDARSSESSDWTGTSWRRIRNCTEGFEEAYLLQSRRLTSNGYSTERHTLFLGRKTDGTWWVSGTQKTGLGNAVVTTTVDANNIVLKSPTIPDFAKIYPGEAFAYNASNLDRNWYMRHQVFVEHEALGIHQSTGDQGTCYALANGTYYGNNSQALADVAQGILDDGGIQMVVPHVANDYTRNNMILSKAGKLYFTGQGVDASAGFLPGMPNSSGTEAGYWISGPYDMPNFG